MRIPIAVLMSLTIVSMPAAVCRGAEVVSQGSGDYEAAMTATYRTIPMEKEHLEMQFEVVGVVVNAPESSPLHKATIYALSELHSVKGEYAEKGFARYSRPDGDTIFMIHEASGRIGGERTIRGTFVGGTGKCTGITGTAQFRGTGRFKPPTEGMMVSVSQGTFTWKLP